VANGPPAIHRGIIFPSPLIPIKRLKPTGYSMAFRREDRLLPMNKTFWGDYFGMFTDKFGVNWMVSFNEAQQNK